MSLRSCGPASRPRLEVSAAAAPAAPPGAGIVAASSGGRCAAPIAPLAGLTAAPSQQQRLWRILWSGCPGVGVVRLQQLERFCGGLAACWGLSPEDFSRLSGWSPALLAEVERYRQHWGPDPLPRLLRERRGGRGLLLPVDPAWPDALDGLSRPPLWLHWQGLGSLWPLLGRRQAIAVVGTRRPSEHGLLMARRIGAQLAARGWPVLSGLAEGIDAAAHQGCLEHGGAPVGVLGTPLQRVYPSHHRRLQREVGRRGLLISEWPAGAPVRPGHFASRNRLLVALAAAVVVVECPAESGALHSAELAWQQGLPLWAVPGDAARASALGSNRLLTRGATPLLLPADLTDQLGAGPLAGRLGRSTASPARPAAAAMPAGSTAARVMAALGEGADLEELAARLGLKPSLLSSTLLELELAGLVRPQPGLRWQPC